MSILSSIFGKLFSTNAQAAPAGASGGTPSAQQAPVSPTSSGSSAPMPPPNVDVAAFLDKAVAAKGQKLNWKTSIVDLMKALDLDLDSSLQARQALAKELHYTGDHNDSAKDEHLVARPGDEEGCGKRWKSSGRSQGLKARITAHGI